MSACHVLVADLEYGPVNAAVLRLLPWLREASAQRVVVLSVFDGGIRREFADLAPVTAVNEYRPRRPSTALRELGLSRAAEAARSVGLRRRLATGSVYLADVRAARLLEWVGTTVPVVGHLRALDRVRWAALPEVDRRALSRVDRWLVEPGAPDRDEDLRALAEEVPFAEDVPLELCWPDVRATSRAGRRAWLEAECGVPADGPLVASGGHVDFWHQTDLFAQFCWTVRASRRASDLRFGWFGGDSTERMLWPLRHDLAHAGLDAAVHVVDRADVPLLEAAAAADVWVRTNRHDPDPWIEGAMTTAGVPRVGFAPEPSGPRAGELAPGAGPAPVLVPWPDVDGLAHEALALVASPPHRAALGQLPAEAPSVWDRRVAGRVLADQLRRP